MSERRIGAELAVAGGLPSDFPVATKVDADEASADLATAALFEHLAELLPSQRNWLDFQDR